MSELDMNNLSRNEEQSGGLRKHLRLTLDLLEVRLPSEVLRLGFPFIGPPCGRELVDGEERKAYLLGLSLLAGHRRLSVA